MKIVAEIFNYVLFILLAVFVLVITGILKYDQELFLTVGLYAAAVGAVIGVVWMVIYGLMVLFVKNENRNISSHLDRLDGKVRYGNPFLLGIRRKLIAAKIMEDTQDRTNIESVKKTLTLYTDLANAKYEYDQTYLRLERKELIEELQYQNDFIVHRIAMLDSFGKQERIIMANEQGITETELARLNTKHYDTLLDLKKEHDDRIARLRAGYSHKHLRPAELINLLQAEILKVTANLIKMSQRKDLYPVFKQELMDDFNKTLTALRKAKNEQEGLLQNRSGGGNRGRSDMDTDLR